ncbi:MAG: hypothetical protein J3T61_08020, partial [Candidatus Brocadiales bacterium]|nr:hypothetical protein [Candidatus Bathyanammoxibius sp.]
WLKLSPRYNRVEPPADTRLTPVRTVFVAEEIAQELATRYGYLGLVVTQKENDITRSQLEQKSNGINLTHRQRVINAFETQRRDKIMSGHGRSVPSDYEIECYRVVGKKLPTELEFVSNQGSSEVPSIPHQPSVTA